jgi:NADH-quinone oxidoreductase subunit J
MEIFNILVAAPLLSGLLIVSFKEPMYIILSLFGVLLATAVCWINLDAEFLAFSLILLYSGLMVVLILFVIMMLKHSHHEYFNNLFTKQDNKKYFLPNKLFSTIIIAVFTSIFTYIAKDYNFSVTTVAAHNTLTLLASELFNSHILLFTLSGLFLLTAVIVAVVCLINQ